MRDYTMKFVEQELTQRFGTQEQRRAAYNEMMKKHEGYVHCPAQSKVQLSLLPKSAGERANNGPARNNTKARERDNRAKKAANRGTQN